MQSSFSSINSTIYSIVHYKNALFNGQVINNLKQNTGILLLDNGQVLIGNFNNDQLNGHCIVFLNNQTYVIGSFVRGLLDGQFILRSDQFTVYWIVKMNKVCGEIVVINYESMKARVWLIENGQGTCVKQINISQNSKQFNILSQLSSTLRPVGTCLQFIVDNFSSSVSIESSSLTQTHRISLPTPSSYKLIVTLFKDKIVEYGIYQKDELNGIGFCIQAGNIFQGKFKDGKLNGCGLKYELAGDNIIYGTFKNGDIRTIDVVTDNQDIARRELKQYKKQQHMHSLEYYNNYFNQRPILMLANFLQTIQQNDINFTQQLQLQEESSKKQQYSRSQQKKGDFQPLTGKLKQMTKKSSEEEGSGRKISGLQSRFIKSSQNENSPNTQFSEDIKQFNQINKALRKFK